MIKKKEIKWIIALLILFMLTSCTKTNVLHEEDKKEYNHSKNEINTIPVGENKKTAKENKDEGDSSKNEANIIDLNNYTTTIKIDNEYKKLEDIRPESIPEIKLGFFIDRDRVVNSTYPHYLVKEVSDGYICVSIEKEGDKALSYMKRVLEQSTKPRLNLQGGLALKDGTKAIAEQKSARQLPTLRKLNKFGELIWEKQLKDGMLADTVNHLIVLNNDNIVFLVSGHSSNENYLIKCDKDGNMVWKKDLNMITFGCEKISKIITTDEEEIIIIGLGYHLVSSFFNNKFHIWAMKLDMEGNVLNKKYVGEREYKHIDDVKYNKHIGIAIMGRSSSIGSEHAGNKRDNPVGFVTCIDENFQIQWTFNEDKAGLIYDHLFVSDKELYVMGSNWVSNFVCDNYFIKLNDKGELLGKHSELSSRMWSNGAQLLPSGHLVVGKELTLLVDDDTNTQDELIIFDQDNEVITHLNDLELTPDEIIPTDDGGFIIKAIRPVRTIPQPLYVSSIWYEHEVVLMKFNHEYDIEWRKTYNKYEDLRIDFVWPLKNGSVLVE